MHAPTAVELYWLPLGAGGHSVRFNGRVYEALIAARDGRPRLELYHAALRVRLPEGEFVIEQAPVPDRRGSERGVVVEGPVGSRWAGRFRVLRYEVRLWAGGEIPDIAEAVESPRILSDEEDTCRRVLRRIREVPPLTWGRDEMRTGEMWNSNAVIAWVLSRSGIDARQVLSPPGGRAPGWNAGLAVARGQPTTPPDPLHRGHGEPALPTHDHGRSPKFFPLIAAKKRSTTWMATRAAGDQAVPITSNAWSVCGR